MTSKINGALMRVSRRAETNDPGTLVATFVDVGSLFSILSSRDHQILYGRRGTGKTHALQYLAGSVGARGDVSVYVDMRTIGSTGGIYADPSIPMAERGTRLLVDTLTGVYNALVNQVLEHAYVNDHDFTEAMSHIDRLGDSLTDVRVSGEEERESTSELASSTTDNASLELAIGSRPSMSIQASGESHAERRTEVRTLSRGPLRHRVHYGAVSAALTGIVGGLPGRLWVLLDEWSDVPLDLQPLLADLLRRCLMPVQGISVKIAAIEQRSNFRQEDSTGGYLGFELGADIAADVDLDDFMVFGNDAARAKSFFGELLHRHVSAVMAEEGGILSLTSPTEFVSRAFTQSTAFDEFVRAAEGVPRDAINVGAIAAQHAGDGPISVSGVRSAARRWYLRDKEKAVEANQDASALLHWIIDEVIAGRKARAFLLRQGDPSSNTLVGNLYDARVLHVIKRGVSAHDQPGVRFNVYALDYGCYVELITTANAPRGLLLGTTDDGNEVYVDVPPDDYRSIRRAILDLREFDRHRDAMSASS